MQLTEKDLVCKHVVCPGSYEFFIILPAHSSDPIVEEYLNGTTPNNYMFDIMAETTKPGDLLLDLGAHVGTFALAAAAAGRHVIAVDANPEHVSWLRKSVAVNAFGCLECFNKAISDVPGFVNFVPEGLFGRIDFSGGEMGTKVRVPALKLDDFIAEFPIQQHVKFMKMDIEGAELSALATGRDFISTHQPIIFFESNGMTLTLAGATTRNLREEFESLKYKVFRIEGHNWIYAPPDQMQPEAWVDMIALSEAAQAEWQHRLVWRWPNEELLNRSRAWAALPHDNVKAYLKHEIQHAVVPQEINSQMLLLARDL